MQSRTSVVSTLIALASVCFVGSNSPLHIAQQDSSVVARVGDDSITISDVQEYVQDYRYYLRYPDRAEAFEQALDKMVMDRLKRMDFFASGLHRDSVLVQRIQRRITEELVLQYFKTQYLEKYINEEAIREAYAKMQQEVVYRQIVLPKPPDATSEDIDSLKEKVTEIRALIDQGEDFGTLADRFSHGASSQQGGYEAPITWMESMSNPRSYVIFNLDVGDVRALQTQNAFQIVRVEQRRERSVEPLESVRSDIARKLRGRYAEKAYQEFERKKKKAVDRSAIEWNQEALEQVVVWANTPNFFEEDYRETLQQAIEKGRNFTILTYPGGEVDVKRYLHLLDDVLIMEGSEGHETEDIKSFLVEALRTEVIARKARQLGLQEELMQTNTTNPVLKSQVVRLYNQRKIEEQIPEPTDEALRAFYEAHKDSLFYQLPVVRIFAIIRSDKEEAEQLWSEHEQGVPFDELAHRKKVQSFVRDREGNITTYRSSEAAYLGEEAFKLQEGEVSGPIRFQHSEKGTQYAIIKANDRIPEKQLSYGEAKDKVIEEFTAHHRARIKAAVREELWSKYPVTINRDVLKSRLAAL